MLKLTVIFSEVWFH